MPSLSLCNTLPPTHSLSLPCLALFPSSPIWYKNPGNHFQVIIVCNKLFWYTLLFHLEVAHDTTTESPRMLCFFTSCADSSTTLEKNAKTRSSSSSTSDLKHQGTHSWHFIFFVTYKWALQVRVLYYTRLKTLARDKPFSLIGLS